MHPVRLVSQRTGLSPHVLRVWERRYGVVTPTRSEGGQRLYSDQDIERLTLLRRATEAGRNIGQLAGLSNAALADLVRADEVARPEAALTGSGPELVAAGLRAIERMDGAELEHLLRRGLGALGIAGMVDTQVVPLMVEVGERWHAGAYNTAQEHLASAVVHQVLGEVLHTLERVAGEDAVRRILVATPRGQRHGLGALVVAVSAAALGWRVSYLGTDLPTPDILRAAELIDPDAIALSITYPADDAALAGELKKLCKALPPRCALLLGGASAPAYTTGLPKDRVRLPDGLPGLRRELTGSATAAR